MQPEVVDGTSAGPTLDVATLYADALAISARPLNQTSRTPATACRLHDLVILLRDAGDAGSFLQGACLVRLEFERNYHRIPDCADLAWPEFCEDVLGIGYRRARYLMAIYQKSLELGVTSQTIAQIGWTKMREVLTIATRENVSQWVQAAQSGTLREVTRRVQVARHAQRETGAAPALPPPDVDPGDVAERWSLVMTADQRHNILDGIELVRREAKSRGVLVPILDAEALDLIVTDFRANHLPKDRALKWHLRQLERTYQVKLAVAEEQD